ncbi:uncharacterized protein RCO7_04290 [Rhynchosporium graminicola]|uniref:Pyridoxamine phosphate oxidase family protein n=1 Tax=Rhynchosporium graminicola TaxID=2792576 RepID=A0A1E1L7I4_9HELO|nr:uncharacterized protein RCO7_04290 [Rhynchosporium commune]
MGAFYETIPQSLIDWILLQKVFWIASAPLSHSGHINLSPKGGSYFGVLSPSKFWYIDLTGSGIETLSHLHEPGNGRITVLFNAFSGPPRIVRLWGKGEVLEYGTGAFETFVEEREEEGVRMREMCVAGTRAVVVVSVTQVGSSCGFSMPLYEFQGCRSTLNEFFEKRVRSEEEGNRKDGIEKYWAFKNAQSIDGLPGLRRGVENGKREKVTPIKKMVGPYALEVRAKERADHTRTKIAQFVVVLLAFCMGIFAQWAWSWSWGGGFEM